MPELGANCFAPCYILSRVKLFAACLGASTNLPLAGHWLFLAHQMKAPTLLLSATAPLLLMFQASVFFAPGTTMSVNVWDAMSSRKLWGRLWLSNHCPTAWPLLLIPSSAVPETCVPG